jgi:hypothetical protein
MLVVHLVEVKLRDVELVDVDYQPKFK